MMANFSEANLDAGGHGEQMQLSGSAAASKSSVDNRADIEDDDETRVVRIEESVEHHSICVFQSKSLFFCVNFFSPHF
jgi:hypothetical protein